MADYHEVKEVQIIIDIKYTVSNQTNYFKTVQELASFLKDHPKVAAAVGYVPKKKK